MSHFPKKFRISGLLLLCLILLAGCSAKKSDTDVARFAPYGPAVALGEKPDFFARYLKPQNQELLSFREMAPTIRKSIAYAKSKPVDGLAVARPNLKVTWGELVESLELLRTLLPRLDREPSLLNEKFRWVEVDGGIKYSGYYQPTIMASRKKTGKYTQAIYAIPQELKKIRSRGRRFHSREAIDGPRQILAGRNLELAWADPVDVYFLQIQGSGKVIFDDGTTAYLNYAGQNGHKYRASGRIIREKGYVLYSGDVLEQRQWFKDNPDKIHEIFFANPSYVFFRFGTRGAVGAINQTVDDYMSLAVDVHYCSPAGHRPCPGHGRSHQAQPHRHLLRLWGQSQLHCQQSRCGRPCLAFAEALESQRNPGCIARDQGQATRKHICRI